MFERLSKLTPGAFYQFIIKPDGRYIFSQLSQRVAAVVGIPKVQFEVEAGTFFRKIPESFRALMRVEISKSGLELSEVHFVFPLTDEAFDKKTRWYETRAIPKNIESGEVQWTGFIYEVTTRECNSPMVKGGRGEAANFILDNMLDAIITTDRQGFVLYANSVADQLFGFEAGELEGQNIKVIIPKHHSRNHDRYLSQYHRTRQAHVIGHNRRMEAIDRAGQLIPIELRVSEFSGGADFHFLGTIRDLRPQIQNKEQVESLKNKDLATGLLNRNGLIGALNSALDASVTKEDSSFVLISIDIDDFHLLNNGYGTEAGDLVLNAVSNRLKDLGLCTVARIHKDEFALLLYDSLNALKATRTFESIKSAIELPVVFKHQTLSFRVTAGAYSFTNCDLTAHEILHRSQTALGAAKRHGRGEMYHYDAHQADDQRVSAVIDQKLKSSDYLAELFLVYQPQFEKGKGVIGYEALLRWENEGKLIPPDKFIPIAEHNGAIIEIGHWLLEQACQFLLRLPPKYRLSINISPKQFQQPNFVGSVINSLRNHGLEPHLLHLELTERLLIESVGDVVEKMTALNSAGITFSLDDFGTGYSSLSYLSKLPLSELKIDKSFITNLQPNTSNYRIVESIISLSKSLGLSVIAEGVETAEEHSLLNDIGCHCYQGYLFSKPLKLDQIYNSY